MSSEVLSDAQLAGICDIAVILHPTLYSLLTDRLIARSQEPLNAKYFNALDRHNRILLANKIFTFESDNIGLDIEGRFSVKLHTTQQLFPHVLSKVITDTTILLHNMGLLVDQHMK
jgi:hypothetical protein